MKKKVTLANKISLSEINAKKEKHLPIKVYKGCEDHEVEMKGDQEKIYLQFYKTFGSVDAQCATALLKQVHDAHPEKGTSNAADIINQTTPLLHAIEPRDELEGMLAVQMVGIHNLTMEMMNRAAMPDQTVDGVNRNINRATKLSRTFVAQLEALNKHRNKGQQKMIVEHVHVNDGGQAIIGNIERGGGNDEK